MLRRAPTVLTLTSEDLKAYEDRKKVAVFKTALAAQQQQRHYRQQQQQQQHTPLTDHQTLATSSASSSSEYDEPPPRHLRRPQRSSHEDDENIDDEEEEEDSYYPRRYRIIDEPEDPSGRIYRNEMDQPNAADNTRSTRSDSITTEDQVMAELGGEELASRTEHESGSGGQQAGPMSRFARRTAAVTPTTGAAAAAAGGRGYAGAAVATPEAPVRLTRSREERILGRGGRR